MAAPAGRRRRPRDAAFHLDRLVRDGLLDASYRRLGARSGPGAGRPSKLYRRGAAQATVNLPQRQYELAARLLLRAVADSTTPAARETPTRAAHEVGEALGREARAAGPRVRRTEVRERLVGACASRGSSRSPTRRARSACATVPSTRWPAISPTWSAA
jgi:predicted ArsR family transcriptional regulator